MIITIDGFAGTGKSTVAKLLAEKLHFLYFDTGAMYRAFSWKILQDKININNQEKIAKALEDFHFEIKDFEGRKKYFVNTVDVTQLIRKPEVSAIVSQVSSFAHVRRKLVEIQKSYAKTSNVVFEGRDMGTVVFPKADLKIFLVAREEERAQRRFLELKKSDPNISYEQIFETMKHRDHLDSTRKISPLKKAQDAIEIDTSDIDAKQVVEKILDLKEKLSTKKKKLKSALSMHFV